MTRQPRLPILLAIWISGFLLVAWIVRVDCGSVLGLTGLLVPGNRWLATLATLFCLLLACISYLWLAQKVVRMVFGRDILEIPEVAMLGVIPFSGILLSLLRLCLGGESTDWIAVLEPTLLGVGVPLFLLGWGILFAIPLRLGDRPTPGDGGATRLIILNLIGSIGISTALFLLALAGLFSPYLLLLVWLMGAVVGGFVLFGTGRCSLFCPIEGFPRDSEHEPPATKACRPPGSVILLLGLCTVLMASFFLACLPPDDSDELRYHMTFPKRYLEQGQWVNIEEQAFSHFPQALEILTAVPLSLDWLRPQESRQGFVSGGKFLHLWFFCLCLLVLSIWSRRLSEEDELDLSAPWLFACVPFVPILASWSFVDFASAFGWLASAYFGWKGIQSRCNINHSWPFLISAAAVGWSIAVKYPSLAWWVILGSALLCCQLVSKQPTKRLIAFFALVPPLIASPWLIHNAWTTGNPFAPLLSSIFGGGFTPVQKAFYDWHAGMKGGLNAFRDQSFPNQFWDLVALPFRAALFPEQFEFNPIGGLLILLAPLAIAAFVSQRSVPAGSVVGKHLIGFLSLSVYLLWALTYRDPRFALPLWGFLALAISVGLTGLSPLSARVRSAILGALLFFGLSQTEETFLRIFRFQDAILWKESPADYVSRPDRIPALATVFEVERKRSVIEGEVPKLLLLGQEQSYYFNSPVVGADYFDGPYLAELARESQSIEEISARLKAKGLEWIWINRGTLEVNAFNLIRGSIFCLPMEQGALRMERIAREFPFGFSEPAIAGLLREASQDAAFRRMHAWLIRHPGYREIPLESVPEEPTPISPYYRDCLQWPELKGVPIADLPRSLLTLLVRDDSDQSQPVEPIPPGTSP